VGSRQVRTRDSGKDRWRKRSSNGTSPT
jgi:hypothetical protein